VKYPKELVRARASSSIVSSFWCPPSGGRAGLQLFTLAMQFKTKKCKDIPPVLTIYNTTKVYNNYLTRLSEVNVFYRQPVCHYAAPLLGNIKSNAK